MAFGGPGREEESGVYLRSYCCFADTLRTQEHDFVLGEFFRRSPWDYRSHNYPVNLRNQ